MKHLTTIVLTALLCVPVLAQEAPDADGDGMTDATEKALGLPVDVKQEFTFVAKDEDRKYTPEEAKQNGADILRGEVACVSGDTLVFKTTFAHPFDLDVHTLNIYLDMDNSGDTGRQDPHHKGVDIMLMLSKKGLNPSPRSAFYKENRPKARFAMQDNVLYIALTATFTPVDGKLPLGIHYLTGSDKGRQDGAKHKVIDVPVKE